VTPDAKTARLAAAIENNVDWCDRVCRVNGLAPQRTATAWTSAVRTPQFYPDAISLAADTTADEILEIIDLSEGCSVKDSFATLDLYTYGFTILFEGIWVDLSAAKFGNWDVDTLLAQGGVNPNPSGTPLRLRPISKCGLLRGDSRMSRRHSTQTFSTIRPSISSGRALRIRCSQG
jgi:hypothetical protein